MRLLFIPNDQLINVKCGSINCTRYCCAHIDNFIFFGGQKGKLFQIYSSTARGQTGKKMEETDAKWMRKRLFFVEYKKGGNLLEIEHKIEVELQEWVRERGRTREKCFGYGANISIHFTIVDGEHIFFISFGKCIIKLQWIFSQHPEQFYRSNTMFVSACLFPGVVFFLSLSFSYCLFIAAAVVASSFSVQYEYTYFFECNSQNILCVVRARISGKVCSSIEWFDFESLSVWVSDTVCVYLFICVDFYLSCSFLNSNVSSCQFYWWIKAFCFCLHMECERLNRCLDDCAPVCEWVCLCTFILHILRWWNSLDRFLLMMMFDIKFYVSKHVGCFHL